MATPEQIEEYLYDVTDKSLTLLELINGVIISDEIKKACTDVAYACMVASGGMIGLDVPSILEDLK